MKFKVGIGKNNKTTAQHLKDCMQRIHTISSSELRDGPHLGFLLQILKITCTYINIRHFQIYDCIHT